MRIRQPRRLNASNTNEKELEEVNKKVTIDLDEFARRRYHEPENCIICGKKLDATRKYYGLCSDECFHKDFWNHHVQGVDDTASTRIKGVHYRVGKEFDGPSHAKGFSGRHFRIHYTKGPLAGQTIDTTNLWYQGPIPQDFQEALFDNAEFVEIEQRQIGHGMGFLGVPKE